MAKKLYVVRVEWSQTDHEFIAVWATDRTSAQDKIESHCPGAYYYSIAAIANKILDQGFDTANQITLVKGDNWQGIYINDRLVMEDHSITGDDIMRLMLYRVFDHSETLFPDQDWLDSIGNYPEHLGDVVLENGKTVTETRG